MVDRLPEETGARHRRHSHLPDHLLAESEIILTTQIGRIHHDVVGAFWFGVAQAALVQVGEDDVTLPLARSRSPASTQLWNRSLRVSYSTACVRTSPEGRRCICARLADRRCAHTPRP